MIGKPGAGRVPGARPLQRAGRPHDGHLGEDARAVPGRARTPSSASTSPRKHGFDTVDAIRAMRDGQASVFIGDGRQLRLGHPGHRGHRGRAAQLRTDGAGLDEAQPQPRRPRQHRAHPADPGPHRPRHPGRRQAAGLRRGFDVDGASVPRRPAAAAATQLRSEVAIVCQLARALLGADHPVPWERVRRRLRPHPRRTSPRVVPGLRRLQRARCAQPDGFVLPHPPRDAREFHTATGQGQLRGQRRSNGCRCPRAGCMLQTMRSHDQYNTTIYGLDDRYRGVKGGRRVVFVNPDDIADARIRATATASTWSPSSLAPTARSRSAAPTTSGSSPTRPRRATPRPTTPRPIRWCRWTTLRQKSNTPVSKASPIAARTCSNDGFVVGRVTTRRARPACHRATV